MYFERMEYKMIEFIIETSEALLSLTLRYNSVLPS